MENAPEQFLITGAVGWLGKRLVQVLAHREFEHEVLKQLPHDLRVRCLVLPGSDDHELRELGDRVARFRGDLRRLEDGERFCEGSAGAILVHTAGVIHPRRVAEFYQVNVVGTRNILEAAAAARIRRAVVVSSNSPIGCSADPTEVFDERSPYNPYMNYGRSKMLMEEAVKGMNSGLEWVIVRAPWFYGPGQPPRQTRFFRLIRKGRVPIVGSGNNVRSMVYLDNLCEGLLLAAVTPEAASRVYWIADERPYTMNEIVGTIERLLAEEFQLKVARRRFRLPPAVGSVARLADAALQALGLYSGTLHVLGELDRNIACSISKACLELRYRPRIGLEEGMRRSIRWCLAKGLPI